MTEEVKPAVERLYAIFDVRREDIATIRAALEQAEQRAREQGRRDALEQAEREREADVLSWGNAAIEAQHAETAAMERAELAERRVAELEAKLEQAERERDRLQARVREAEESAQRARWDLDTANASLLEACEHNNQFHEQGRREGLEQAAKIADDRESEWSRDYQMMLVPSEHMLGKAHGAREIAAAIHAAKEVK